MNEKISNERQKSTYGRSRRLKSKQGRFRPLGATTCCALFISYRQAPQLIKLMKPLIQLARSMRALLKNASHVEPILNRRPYAAGNQPSNFPSTQLVAIESSCELGQYLAEGRLPSWFGEVEERVEKEVRFMSDNHRIDLFAVRDDLTERARIAVVDAPRLIGLVRALFLHNVKSPSTGELGGVNSNKDVPAR